MNIKQAARLLNRYSMAIRKWIAAGKPVRTEEEQQRILEICKACQYYSNNRCLHCGCQLMSSYSFLAKIKMATEHCPIHKW